MLKDLALPAPIGPEDADTIYAAIDELRPRCRMALKLAAWDGLTPPEIVQWMAGRGISMEIETVMSYLTHASRHIRQRLEEAAAQRNLPEVSSGVIRVMPLLRASAAKKKLIG